MQRLLWGCLALALMLQTGSAAESYSVKTAKSAPPKELNEAVTKQLSDQSVQFLGDKDAVLAEVWLNKQVPSTATDAQIKNGLTWQEVEQTTLLGVVKVNEQLGDYKKHKIKPGVYTLRLAMQPMDGDHMGTAPYAEFALLVPAAQDEGKVKLEAEDLNKMSKRASGAGHPAVWVLFPVPDKELGAEPRLLKREGGHWGISAPLNIDASGKKARMGLGLNIVGASPAA